MPLTEFGLYTSNPEYKEAIKIKANFNEWLKNENNKVLKPSPFAVKGHQPVLVFRTKTAAILWFYYVRRRIVSGWGELHDPDPPRDYRYSYLIWADCKVLVKPKEKPHHDYVKHGIVRLPSTAPEWPRDVPTFLRTFYVTKLRHLSTYEENAVGMIQTAGFKNYNKHKLGEDLQDIQDAMQYKGNRPGN